MTWYNKYSHFHRNEASSGSPNRGEKETATGSRNSRTVDQQNYYDQIVRNNPDIMQNKQPFTDLPLGSILLYNITPDEFFEKIKGFVKEALQQDQLLTKQGAMKMAGVSTAKFKKAIEEGIVKPQLIKGRTTAMYLESEVVKIAKKAAP